MRDYKNSGLRGRLARSCAIVAAVFAIWGDANSAEAQIWQGMTSDYNNGANWLGNVAPTGPGQTATFDSGGSSTVTVTSGPVTPDSWTFNATSQSYLISGAAVNFNGNGTNLVNNANSGQTITISNNLNGHAISQAGNSTLVLSGAVSLGTGGVASITAGTLAFSGSGSLIGIVNLQNAAVLDISNTTSGATLNVRGNSTASTVNLGDQTLTLTTTTGFSVEAAIQGSGNVVIATGNGGAARTVGFDGMNTYTGTTTLSTHTTLIIGNGSIASSSGVILQNNAELFGISSLTIKNLSGDAASTVRSDGTLTITEGNSTFNGKIVDDNPIVSAITSLAKNGSGVFTLTNTNTYTGTTTVNGGSLVVDGSIASSPLTTVNAGGTLAGSGTVGNAAIAGGTLAPGSTVNAFGPLTVSGTLSFTAASTYLIQVSPTNAGLTNVSGIATLGGAGVRVNYLSQTLQKQYTILHADGGVSGTFNPQVASNNANISSTLSYDADDVFLNTKLNFVPPGGSLNANQQSVANAIVNFFDRNGSIPLVFSSLSPGGLSQLSGESATGSQQTTFDAMTQFMGVMTDPFVAGRGDGPGAGAGGAAGYANEASAYAARRKPDDAMAAIYTKARPLQTFEQRWSVWAAGFGGSQTTDGNVALGSNNTSSSVAGTAVGADYRFSPDTIAGFALAGGGTSFSVNGLGYGRSDLFQAGAFARHTEGAAYISGALAYGWQEITTDRIVAAAGLDHLRAEFNANAYSGRVESGYRFVVPAFGGLGLTPYAAGQFTTFDLPAYAETVVTGSPLFALNYAGKNVTDTRSELGFRSDKSFAIANGILTLRGRLAWAHDFDPDRSLAATFQSLPGASFVVNGAAQASDFALTTAALEMKWLNGWSAAATFEGEFSNVTESYAGKGVVRYAW